MVARSSAIRVCCLLMGAAAMGLLAVSLLGRPREPSAEGADVEAQAAPDRLKRLGRQYSKLRASYQDLTYAELRTRLAPEPTFLEDLPFDPTQSRYFDLVDHRLELTDQERALFAQNGFVSIDQGRGLSFPAAYQQIYTSDLPVFITSDSILHALHRSYDDILTELETSYFHVALDGILADCQMALAQRAPSSPPALRDNLRDADLYLGVARKLLHTPPESALASLPNDGRLPGPPMARAVGLPAPVQYSVLGREAAIDERMADIDTLRLQSPANGDRTEIYGGTRYVDYSQFRPRGHYTESAELAAYFRCLMWLGRADCGWNVCPSGELENPNRDSCRELRDAVLLTELLRDSGGAQRLEELDRALEFLVGRSDNFGVIQLSELLRTLQIGSLVELMDADVALRFQQAIAASAPGEQLIRSQTLAGTGGTEPASAPKIFQLFGQRFTIESFVLSKVVHDEIVFRGRKEERHEPTALDVMAALGNDEALGLLSGELGRWNYSANMLACREIAQNLDAGFWTESLHHAWVDSLRSLDADMTGEPYAPAALRTRAWQRKQLQTQLASWTELRRDNILYAKQSYSVPGCAFPRGYVEPYPEFYAKLKRLADTAGRVLGGLSLKSHDVEHGATLKQNHERVVAFFGEMSLTMRMLEEIARDELQRRPLSNAQQDFLRGTFDDRGSLKFGSASLPDFNGWYCRLFYGRLQDPTGWAPLVSKPVVADVHTNPNNSSALEVATGDVRLLIICIDDGPNPTAYVGPVSCFYEFWQPAEQRLTDQAWIRLLASAAPPARPAWVAAFETLTVHRKPESPRVTARRVADVFETKIEGAETGSVSESMGVSASTVQRLASQRNLHSLDLSDSDIGDDALPPLAGLSDLRSLDLSGTKVTDEGVASLKEQRHLQFLDLSATAISDALVPWLSGLVNLSQLDLRDTQLSEAAVLKVRRQLPHTEVLY